MLNNYNIASIIKEVSNKNCNIVVIEGLEETMNLRFIKKTIMAFVVSIFLGIKTKDLLTRIVVIPFLIFEISLFIKNICLIFKKNEIAKIFSK